MPITPLPPPPSRSDDPANFSSKADALLGALPTFVTEANALETNVNNKETSASASATSAGNSATAAANSSNLAAASANFKGAWASLVGSLNKPASVLHSNTYWALLNNLADVTASEPGVTADWAIITAQVWTVNVTASGSIGLNTYVLASATGADITLTMPAFIAGSFIVVNNSPQSTHNVKLTVPTGMTFYGFQGSATAGDNIVLIKGETAHLAADSATVGRII